MEHVSEMNGQGKIPQDKCQRLARARFKPQSPTQFLSQASSCPLTQAISSSPPTHIPLEDRYGDKGTLNLWLCCGCCHCCYQLQESIFLPVIFLRRSVGLQKPVEQILETHLCLFLIRKSQLRDILKCSQLWLRFASLIAGEGNLLALASLHQMQDSDSIPKPMKFCLSFQYLESKICNPS